MLLIIHEPSVVEVCVELVELASGGKACCMGYCLLLAPRGSLLFEALADFYLLFECLFQRDLAVVVNKPL